MVLFSTYELTSARGLTQGLKTITLLSSNCSSLTKSIVFNLCKVCGQNAMAAIPPSAFSAGRIRETQRDQSNMKMSNPKIAETRKFFNTTSTELSPLKYNSKLMNSIWGFYNRYSPHNVKKVNDAYAFNGELQQIAGNSSNKAEPVITLPPANFDNVWATH